MNRMIRIAASLFTLAGAVSLAHAEQGGDPGCTDKRAAFHQKKLERFDLDKDGRLSEVERAQAHQQRKQKHEQRRAEMLTKYDADKDGVLSETERVAMKQAHVQRMFARLDANADGKLTRDEVKCGPLAQRFDGIDLDKSGALSPEELGKAAPMHRGGRHGDHAARRVLHKRVVTL